MSKPSKLYRMIHVHPLQYYSNLTQAKAAPTAEPGANAAEEPKPVHLRVHGPTHLFDFNSPRQH